MFTPAIQPFLSLPDGGTSGNVWLSLIDNYTPHPHQPPSSKFMWYPLICVRIVKVNYPVNSQWVSGFLTSCTAYWSKANGAFSVMSRTTKSKQNKCFTEFHPSTSDSCWFISARTNQQTSLLLPPPPHAEATTCIFVEACFNADSSVSRWIWNQLFVIITGRVLQVGSIPCFRRYHHSAFLPPLAHRGPAPRPNPSANLKKPGGLINCNSIMVMSLLFLGLRLRRVWFLEAGCVYILEVFSSDLSLPQGPATLICSAITQISQLRQIADLPLHIDLPGHMHTHKHTTSVCCGD